MVARTLPHDAPPETAEVERQRADALPHVSFEAVYDAHADFVHRSLRRLGVPDANVDDALQDVFLVVHRRLSEYRGAEYVKTWLFRIAMNVARGTRRRLGRDAAAGEDSGSDAIADTCSLGPLEQALKAERVRLLYRLLEQLDDDKRVVFILAELEQMPVKDIAETLSINVNTTHSRLRAARSSFEDALARLRARAGSAP